MVPNLPTPQSYTLGYLILVRGPLLVQGPVGFFFVVELRRSQVKLSLDHLFRVLLIEKNVSMTEFNFKFSCRLIGRGYIHGEDKFQDIAKS